MTNKEALITVSKSCKALAMEFGFGKISDKDKTALNTLKQLVVEHQQLKEENQKLKGKATPKKLKPKTDKDGKLMLVCPTCGDVYIKFWSDAETVSCREYCDECGQKLDWSDE